MHFIGNRAIVMAGGKPDMQIGYNTSFTSLSFLLPIVVLSGAFYLLGATDRINRYYIAFAGVLMALAVVSMHYVAQLGISNYYCHFRAGHVVGASIISLFASMAALNIFFRIRETWTDSWWKRALCGLVLACSVSGMHWTATVGTSYRFKGFGSSPTDPLSGKQTVIVCTTLVRPSVSPSGIGSDVQTVCRDLPSYALGCFDCRLQEEQVPQSSPTASACLRILR